MGFASIVFHRRISRKERKTLLRCVGVGLALVCLRSLLLFAQVSAHAPDATSALIYDPVTYRRLRVKGKNGFESSRLRVYSERDELTISDDGNTLLPVVRGLSYAERLGLSKRFNMSEVRFVTCGGGKQRLSWDAINDNYCDCPTDGMDEPGTSACDNGRFWCGEADQRYIFSSRVDDGVCDCCDGSDEPEGRCPNDCRNAVKERLAESRGRRKALEIKRKILEDKKHVASSRGFPYDLQHDIEAGLDGVCFAWTDIDFTYDLCPFGARRRAQQKERRKSNKGVSIGGSPSWKELIFWLTSGGRCFNGLIRSTSFTFICSAETGRSGKGKVNRVLETSTCLYSVEILTPLACIQESR